MKKNMFKLIMCVSLIAFNMTGYAQNGEKAQANVANVVKNGSVIMALKVGDQAPEYLFDKIVNFPKSSAKLADLYKGKLLILDFWSLSCSVCIAGFPKVDSLQREFGDKVLILPVGFEYQKGSIEKYILKNKGTSKEMKLPTAIVMDEKSNLRKYFPSQGVPHYVWINSTGKIVGLTSMQAFNRKNIQGILDGKEVKFRTHIVGTQLKFNDEFLIKRSIGKAAYGSQIVKGKIDSVFRDELYLKDEKGFHHFRGINNSIYEYYQYAYENDFKAWSPISTINKRCVIEVDKPFPRPWSVTYGMDDKSYSEFLDNDIFSYELICPPNHTKAAIQNIIRDDLDRYLGVTSKIERRKIKYLALINSKDKRYSKANISAIGYSNPRKRERFRHSFAIKGLLGGQLEYTLSTNEPIIVDETFMDIDSLIEMELPMPSSIAPFKVGELNFILARYGLQLVYDEKEMEVLVFKDREKAAK